MLRPPVTPSKRTGFTLVELLAVLTLTGLLAAQIVPASRNARDDVRKTLCAQRLGEISRAALVYAAADPGENGIPIGLGDALYPTINPSPYAYGGKSGQGTDTNPRLVNSYWSGANFMNAFNRPLNHLLYKQPLPNLPLNARTWAPDARLKLDVYHCPADQSFPGMHHAGWRDRDLSSYNFYGTSYAANAFFAAFPGQPQLFSNSLYALPLSDTPNPANTVFYWENAARFAPWAPNPDDYDQSGCYWNYGLFRRAGDENMVAHGNHGQDWFFNTTFADGHVDYLEIQGYGRTTGIDDELIASGFCFPSGSGTTCDCILIRGLGWQLDVFPTPPVDLPWKFGGSSSSEFGVVP